MTFENLIQRIVADGRESVNRHEHAPELKHACLHGFDLLATMKEPNEVYSAVSSRRSVELKMQIDNNIDAGRYWEYRHATAQLEYAWEILKVALGRDCEMISARAVLKYAEIIKAAEEEKSVQV